MYMFNKYVYTMYTRLYGQGVVGVGRQRLC